MQQGANARTAFVLENIMLPEQDIDLVVAHADGTRVSPEQMDEFRRAVEARHPRAADGRSLWDVIGLDSPHPERKKMALATDPNFLNQHNDSLSLGLLEITEPPRGESLVRNLGGKGDFLGDAAGDEMRFLFSSVHESTAFFKEGRNPPILSAIRALEKSFRYGKKLDEKSLADVKKIIEGWDPKEVKPGTYVSNYLHGRGKRLLSHALDLAAAQESIRELGLEKKLLGLPGVDAELIESLAWWLKRKPLPKEPALVKPTGRTAADLGISEVYHWASESNHRLITWNYDGSVRALQSRPNVNGENAALGEGFYTFVNSDQRSRATQISAKLPVKMHVDPTAREGVDFALDATTNPPVAVWKSSRYLSVAEQAVTYSPNMKCSGLYANFAGRTKMKVRDKISLSILVALPVGSIGYFGKNFASELHDGLIFSNWNEYWEGTRCMKGWFEGGENGCKSKEASENSLAAALDIYKKHSPLGHLIFQGKPAWSLLNWLRAGLTFPERSCVKHLSEIPFAKKERENPTAMYPYICGGRKEYDYEKVSERVKKLHRELDTKSILKLFEGEE